MDVAPFLPTSHFIPPPLPSLPPFPQGKFIRIHFGNSGKISGADIEYCKYLLQTAAISCAFSDSDCPHYHYSKPTSSPLLFPSSQTSWRSLVSSSSSLESVATTSSTSCCVEPQRS